MKKRLRVLDNVARERSAFILQVSSLILVKLRPARLERAIFAFGGRRLIHWATGAKNKRVLSFEFGNLIQN